MWLKGQLFGSIMISIECVSTVFVLLRACGYVGDGFFELCTPTAGVCFEQDTAFSQVQLFTGNPLNARPLGAGVDGDGNAIFCRSNGLLYKYDDATETLAEFVTYDDGGDVITDTDCFDVDVGPHFGDLYYVTTNGFLRVFGDTAQSTSTLLTTGLGDASGIAVDTRPIGEAKVYISDASANLIRQYDSASEDLTTLAIPGLEGPTGLAIDRPNGDILYICDTGNSVVKKYDFNDGSVTTLPFVLDSPTHIAIDMASQELFISDSGSMRVYRFNQIDDELASTSISTLPSAFGGFNLNTPTGVAVTLTGTILVADSLNKRILKVACNELVYKCDAFDTSANAGHGGEYVGIFPVFGGVSISVNDIDTCDYGYAPNAISTWACNASTGVASSTLPFCVVDGGNCVDMNTTLLPLFTTGYQPYYTDIDSAGNVIFSGLDTGDGSFNIYIYDPVVTTVTTLYTLASSTVGGVALDNVGNLFVADPESGSIFKGECVTFVDGVCQDYTAILDLWSNAFTTPVALDLDPANNIYVADAGVQKLLKYNTRGSLVATLIGSGVLDTPVGVALDDETGDLYVSDKGTDSIYFLECDDLNANCEIYEDCPFRSLCDAARDPAYICCPNGWAGERTATYCTLPDSVDIYNDYLGEDPPANMCNFYGGVVEHDIENSRYTCANSVFQYCDTFSAEVQQLTSGFTPDDISVDRGGNVVYINADSITIEKYNLATAATTVIIAAGMTEPRGVAIAPNGNLFLADPAATSLFETVCLELEPTCSDSEQNGAEEGVDCGGTCADRCQDIASDPIWFVFRDHGITTSTNSVNDFIDHGIRTLEECQGLCHAGVSPTLDDRECVGFTMDTEVLNWPLGALCTTFYTDFDSSQCLKRQLTGAKAFLCFPAPPVYTQDYVVFEQDDVTAFLYKRGDARLYTGLVWYGLGEHQHIGDDPADYVSLGAVPLEDCLSYCVEYEGCLGITNDYALFHEECILYMTDFATSICRDYDTFSERCSDLYPFENVNVVKSNAAYNAYVFEAANYNGFVLFRTHTNGYLDGTVDSSTTEATFITSVEGCKLYCMKHSSCKGFRSDNTNCIVYLSYIEGTGVDAVRTATNVSSTGVQHWIKYQRWQNAKCDTLLSTGGVDHGTVYKLSECLALCETVSGCSAAEFSFIQSSCITYTTCIGVVQTPLHAVYGSVGFIESTSCADLSDWTSPSGATCETSKCLFDSMYLAYTDGSYWTGVSNDTIAPDCLNSDCCKWRCFYHPDCVASTFETYSELFWSFEDDGYPCTTYVNLTIPRNLITPVINETSIEAQYVKIVGYTCEDDWGIVLEDGSDGVDVTASTVLDCQDGCDERSGCWGFNWQPSTEICHIFHLVGGAVPAHNLTGDKSLFSCRSSSGLDNSTSANECCSCGGGVREYPVGAQNCEAGGRDFPAETSPLCVAYNTTSPSGNVLYGNLVVREDSATDTALWNIVSEQYTQRSAWCDRNDNWDLDVRACYTEGNVTSCGTVLHTSPGESQTTSIVCELSASGCPNNYPYGFELGAYCCDVPTNETQQVDDPIPDDLSWTQYVSTSDVTVDTATGSNIFVRRYGPDVSFAQCTSGAYIECPQAGTYQLGDNCRNHTGYWNVPALNRWRVVDQNGVECNQTADVENEAAYDLGEPELLNNTWYLQFTTEVRYFFNGFRTKVGAPSIFSIEVQRSRYGSVWQTIAGSENYTFPDGLESEFIYEFQNFDTFSGLHWRVVITDMYDVGVNPILYWVQFYTPLEKPCLVPTIGNGSWSGDGCFEQQDQAQDLTCSFNSNDGYYCSFGGEYYCDAGVWLFTASSIAADLDPFKDTDAPNGLGYGNYDGDLLNDRDGWDETIDFKLNPVVPDHIACYPCNPDNECPIGEYMVGCGGISPGKCGPCTNAPPASYYVSNAVFTNDCTTASCNVDCPIGQYNAGCNGTTSAGQCVPCTGILPGYYFATDGDIEDSCTLAECETVDFCNLTVSAVTCTTGSDSHCPVCDDGYWLYEDLNGPDQCRPCNKICPIGTYLSNCGNKHYPYFNKFASNSKCASGLGASLLSYTPWTNASACAANCKLQPGCTIFDNSEAFDAESGTNVPFCHMYSDCSESTLRFSNESTVYEYVIETEHDGQCKSCTGAPTGYYYNSTGDESDSCTFAECPSIPNCAKHSVCVANVSTERPNPGDFDYPDYQVQPTSIKCTQCAPQMFIDNYTDVFLDRCVQCTAIANCASNVSCTSLSNSQCTACSDAGNYYIDNELAASRCRLLPETTYTETSFNASFGTWAAQCDGLTLAFGSPGANNGDFVNFTDVELADLVQGISSIFQSESIDNSRWKFDLTARQQCIVKEYFAQFSEPSVSILQGDTYAHYVFSIGSDSTIGPQILNLVQNIPLSISSDTEFFDVFDFLQITSLPADVSFATVTLYSKDSSESIVDYAAMLNNAQSRISPFSYYTTVSFDLFDSAGQPVASSDVELTSCLANPLETFMAFTLDPYFATFSSSQSVFQQVGTSQCYSTTGQSGTFVVLANGCDGIGPAITHATVVCDLATKVGDTCPIVNDANYDCSAITVTCSAIGEYEISTGECVENRCVFDDRSFDNKVGKPAGTSSSNSLLVHHDVRC